jgi:hypothetical protein
MKTGYWIGRFGDSFAQPVVGVLIDQFRAVFAVVAGEHTSHG